MSNSIEKKIFYMFIILQPVLDLLTSIMSRNIDFPLTIGVVVRSLFMGYMFMYALFIYKPKEKIYKYSRMILLSIGIYIILFFGYSIVSKPTSYMLTEIKGVIKLFYFPIVLTGLFIYNDKEKIKISNEFLTYLLLAYTGTIFIATITGTYFRSYNEYLYGLGTIGWFFAANEIGAIIAILAPFTIINVIQNKLNVINITAVILCILSVLYIGTKVPFIGFVGALGLLFVYMVVVAIIQKVKHKNQLMNYKKIMTGIISMSFVFCVLFYQSPIYKNILFNYGHIIQKIANVIQKEEKEGLVNDHPPEGNEPVQEDEIPQEPELEINMHIDQDDVVGSLLSNRTEFANEVKGIFKDSNLPTKLIGLGHVIEIRDDIYTDKTIEMDQLDIVYRHGIIGGILYFAQLILIMSIIIKSVFKRPETLLNLDVVASFISASLGILIAFVSGHVLTAPGVSIFIILSIIILYNNVVDRKDII